ncbi:MAG: HAD family hydrolase [Flavobacterium sp.]|nr:HAD family hydrolase [Pedobacter sp.]
MVQIYKNEAVIFDLDDLLYKEFDYLRSGYWEIAKAVDHSSPKKMFRVMMAQYFLENNVFNWVIDNYAQDNEKACLPFLLNIYRNHKPDIAINADAAKLLTLLKKNGNKIGLITDGRSVTQRNKIDALGLKYWISEFIISEEIGFEKPSPEPYLILMERLKSDHYVYLADNYNKDFLAPNNLGWRTIALEDNGINIHSKKTNLDLTYLPSESIRQLSEINVNSIPLNKNSKMGSILNK